MDSSETMQCPPAYIKSLPGILKCVELVRTKPECFQIVEYFVTLASLVTWHGDTHSLVSLSEVIVKLGLCPFYSKQENNPKHQPLVYQKFEQLTVMWLGDTASCVCQEVRSSPRIKWASPGATCQLSQATTTDRTHTVAIAPVQRKSCFCR